MQRLDNEGESHADTDAHRVKGEVGDVGSAVAGEVEALFAEARGGGDSDRGPQPHRHRLVKQRSRQPDDVDDAGGSTRMQHLVGLHLLRR